MSTFDGNSETILPRPAAPPLDAGAGSTAILDTIDLLEADLAGMTAAVERAADTLFRGARASADAFSAIRAQTGTMAAQSRNATSISGGFAQATEELARASAEIGDSVQQAETLAKDAVAVTTAATATVDSLKSSSSDIGTIVNLIAAIAKKTNLLALNATIEAARAGDAGRGFAVVASEVKSLSVQTHAATEDIKRRIAALQADATALIASVDRIAQAINAIRPLFGAIAGASAQQAATTADLAAHASETSRFVAAVAQGAGDIEHAAQDANAYSENVDQSGHAVLDLVQKLKTRCTIFLRQTELGDRRRHDRLPCDLGVVLRSGARTLSGRSADLSDAGILVRADGDDAFVIGDNVEGSIDGVGDGRLRLVGRSHLGLHMAFTELGQDARHALTRKLEAIRNANREFIDRAIEAANRVSVIFEEAVARGQISQADLFDTDYVPIENTNPQQYRTRSLAWLDTVLPPIQEPICAHDGRTVFCAAVDRNGYLPVHNTKYSKPQRPDDPVWNTANSRNRRIFDDRAGLAAGRSTRPYLIQNYPRDMGNGVTIMMQEIVAPIRVNGKHWGGFRTAYRL